MGNCGLCEFPQLVLPLCCSAADWLLRQDWSNGKGTGTADGWAKHKPMDDEEMLFKQVQMTAAATKGTTVWVYRNTVYGYPWYTDVRKTLEDPAYAVSCCFVTSHLIACRLQ